MSPFNKVAGSKFVKKRLQHRRFPVKFVKFLRTPILKYICEVHVQKYMYFCSFFEANLKKVLGDDSTSNGYY